MFNKKNKVAMSGIQRLLEVGLIATAGYSLFLLLSLFTFVPEDPSWSQSRFSGPINNAAGAAGAWTADILFFFLGAMAYVIPLVTMYLGWILFRRHQGFFEIDFLALGLRMIGLVLLIIALTSLASMNINDIYYFSSGGLMGDVISESLLPYFNFIGTSLLLLCFFCTGFTLLFGISWLDVIDQVGAMTIFIALKLYAGGLWLKQKLSNKMDYEFVEAIKEKVNTDEPLALTNTSTSKTVKKDKIEPNSIDLVLNADVPDEHKEPASLTDEGTDALDSHTYEETETVAEKTSKLNLAAKWFGNKAKDDKTTAKEETEVTHIANELSDEANNLEENEQLKRWQAPNSAVPTNDVERIEPKIGQSDQIDLEELLTPKVIPTAEKQHIKIKPKPQSETAVLNGLNALPQVPEKPEGRIPSFALLDRADKKQNPITPEEMDAVARLVETKLLEYKIKADVVGVYPGPVITRLELDLAPGVKVSAISNLAKDIARSLSAASVRVVEVIPGKPFIGLELPNKHRETVRLSEVLESDVFNHSASPLTMGLGADISGKPVIADLGKMPHVLVAGTTGSGKSVLVNTMIISFLYKSTPEDVRMIMIDPKMLELAVYEDIPHLLCEVVTDMKDASNALRWCVGEMERRYKLMAAVGVRNLKGFNSKVIDNIEAGTPLYDPLWKAGDSMAETAPALEKLPSIVVVIDEFADMMMIVGKKVEELIARIAQKARAAGIHLILATQRPSVDVITGLIKANIPTRIGLSVSSKIDSRTILDQQGAESLLGMGDMLYLPSGSNIPTRAHGAFVDDHEVHAVVADWKLRGKPQYIDDVLSGEDEILLPGELPEIDPDNEIDALFDEAVAFVTETRKVSISSVQRKLRIGYNRAANIVEQMEMNGVVSSAGHNGSREVLAQAAPKN